MVTRNMYRKIQESKKKGLLKSEISRELRLDPGTVAKYYDMSEQEYRGYEQVHLYRDKAFDQYLEDILEVYERNGYRRLPMSSVYDYLEEAHGALPGTEKTFRNYIKYLWETNQLEFTEKVRLYGRVPELPLGRQMQVDFGVHRTAGGLKLYLFCSVLAASRYKYVAFQARPFTTVDLIQHLLDSFDYIGGIPEELVIDQDTVMVVSENHGDIIYTRDFQYFIEEMGINMWVCRKADPESKGKIENLVKYVKGNFLSVRDFATLEEAQESLWRWLTRRANGKICQATKRIPAEVMEEEREHLRPLKRSIYRKESTVGREERIVDDKCRISVDASHYTLPIRYRKKTVEIYKSEDRLFIFDRHTGKQITEYPLSVIPGSVEKNKDCYRKTGQSTQRLREAVLNKYPLERWGEFVRKNFKAFQRYIRDQCLEAERRFGEDIQLEHLDQALEFCLEHRTYSMANLHDTYTYYRRLSESKAKEEEEELLEKTKPQLKGVSRFRREIRVSKRDLGVYTSLISMLTGVWS
jgi:transposase